MDGGKLLHDLSAIAFFVQHTLYAMNLAFDSPQALDKFFFCFRLALPLL
jgi:hypothetical protein